jgi:hypothetical protein
MSKGIVPSEKNKGYFVHLPFAAANAIGDDHDGKEDYGRNADAGS